MRKITVVMTTLPTNNEQTGSSPIVAAANGTSRFYGEFARCDDATYFLDVTAVSGTSATLDIVIEGWDEAAGKWRTETTIPQVVQASVPVTPAAVDQAKLRYKRYRARWTIGGTASPTFTFSLMAIARASG